MTETLGNRVKLARAARGLSQKRLAEMCGVSQSAVDQVERGVTARPKWVFELTRALGVSQEWLIHGIGPAPEISHKLTANKGNAISGIQKELDISPEETLVFGDYLNDLEMMQNAKYSYAMKNAHPEFIKSSKYVTTFSNNENGVLKTIDELGLLKAEYTLKS